MKIIAVEPQLECINYLERRFGKRITLVPNGLGAMEETKTMLISTSHKLSSFSQEFVDATKKSGRFSKFDWSGEQKVEMTTLDNLMNIHGRPKFIKIDVEGFEQEVLMGLSTPVNYISIEYTIPERKEALLACIDRLIEIGGKDIRFNYSIGESMEWALTEWMNPDELLDEIDSTRFVKSDFGDIYVKMI